MYAWTDCIIVNAHSSPQAVRILKTQQRIPKQQYKISTISMYIKAPNVKLNYKTQTKQHQWKIIKSSIKLEASDP